VKQVAKQALLGAVSRVTRRTAVLLASQASNDEGILPVVAPYRVADGVVAIQVCTGVPGEMRVLLRSSERQDLPMCRFDYTGPGTLILRLADGSLLFCGHRVGSLSGGQGIASRRFSLQLELVDRAGTIRRRTTSHYLSREGKPVDSRYYTGEDYVDYEAESEAVHQEVVALARAHNARGPALEVGCATGGTLSALHAAGIDAYGIDFSAWAVERARERVGSDHVWHCDIERDPLPDGAVARAPFGLLVLASVFEHFSRPFDVLERLTVVAAPGARLLLITSNADSLTHRIFGGDWEGYFDWTHHGVDAVTARSIRQGLPAIGWRISDLRTWHVWDGSEDPTHATLRDWNAADARFRALLAERELGDFITCVAIRE
jgi:2-polyprenyl-3-methyl-5-hydroxy-6-metoxy-1,4-benzoquinol methylase